MRRNGRRGFSLVETIVALLILSMAIIIIATLTGARIRQQEDIEYQVSYQAVDAFFYSVYNDFHTCESFLVATTKEQTGTDAEGNPVYADEVSGVTLNFVFTEMVDVEPGEDGEPAYQGKTKLYTYQWDKDRNRGVMYQGAYELFECSALEVRGVARNLYMSVRLPSDKTLEMDIYK